ARTRGEILARLSEPASASGESSRRRSRRNAAIVLASRACTCGARLIGWAPNAEAAMLKVHHLNNSRSQRILWLLEEIGVPYEIVHYQRMQPLPLAPPELREVHPLGKSPVITDGDLTIAESGAIIEYLLEKYARGRMQPDAGSPDRVQY